MSFNILIILEDFIKDQYIAGPLVKKILQDVGKHNAKIIVCKNPRFTGISDCMNFAKLRDKIINIYEQVDMFILIVDRDADKTRHLRLAALEQQIADILKPHQVFISEQAWQEVEVWPLSGQKLPSGWNWQDIRSERDSKEKYFLPFAKMKGYSDYPDQGRKQLMRDSLRKWARMKQLCEEDIVQLVDRIIGVVLN